MEVRFKHKRQTNEAQGVVFTINGYHFNGSKVDRCFSHSKIDSVLQHNRMDEHTRLMTREHKTAKPNTQFGFTHFEFFNGSQGLLNGSNSFYNATDAEANQELAEILCKRKKRKRGMRL